MHRLRSYYDADRKNDFLIPTHYQVGENKNKLYCSLCGESYFVDHLIFEDVRKIIEETRENPFICQDCLDEYEDLAHRQ